MPFRLPGEAISPGTNNCSFANEPGLTVTEGLVLAVLEASATSLAVTVRAPAVFSARENVCVPRFRAALIGRLAFTSEEVMPTVSVAVVTKFQLASTALTVTGNDMPAV